MVTLRSPHGTPLDSKRQLEWINRLESDVRAMGWTEVHVTHVVEAEIQSHYVEVDSMGVPRILIEVQHPMLCGCDALPDVP